MFTTAEIWELITLVTKDYRSVPTHLQRHIDNFQEDLIYLADQFLSHPGIKRRCYRELRELAVYMIEARFDFLFYEIGNMVERVLLRSLLGEANEFARKICWGLPGSETLCIYFSQKKCSVSFAEHTSVAKQSFRFCGYNLLDVAAMINANPLLRDEVPVYVTSYHNGHITHLVSLNNRGLATLCLARVKPLRVLPAIASVDEINRLTEYVPPLVLPLASTQVEHDIKKKLNEYNMETTGPYTTITGFNEFQQPKFTVHSYNRNKEYWIQVLY